jgi:formamidopyrimidine-DNA glycosylase
MPELPEVETTCRGITPHLLDQRIAHIIVREPRLRWPVSTRLRKEAQHARIHTVRRRAKYLLIETDQGCIIIHLGMSGSLRIVDTHVAAEKHDHIDLVLENNKVLRFRDPRRFGALLWTRNDPLTHKRLLQLGPEPLEDDFNPVYMKTQAGKRQQAVKTFIMNSHIVVGVGNIYACEALFMAGIHPTTPAGKISLKRWTILVNAIKSVLHTAIAQGGTTLKDFTQSDGQPGYFAQSLQVYGRTGEDCYQCRHPVLKITQGQRSTFYCGHCQH